MSQEHEDVHASNHWNRKTVFAIALIATVVPSVFAIAILSNVLVLPTYHAVAAIALTQVAAPGSTSCPTTGYGANYASATQLPLSASEISLGIWYKTGIHVVASSGTAVSVTERYQVVTDAATPSASSIQLVYCDQTSNNWVLLTPAYDTVTKTWSGSVTGTFFQLPMGYDATTPVMMYVLQSGYYATTLWFETA